VRIWDVEHDRLDFAEFYAAARDDCLRIVLVNVGDRDLAEDLVAEGFTRAWMSWRKLCRHPAPQAWVVRTAWVYGSTGHNFVKTMVRLEGERDTLSVVDDQRGSPTSSAELAAGLLQLAGRIADGQGPTRRVLHCTGGGDTTWFSFARAIFAEIGADPERVKPCTSADFPGKTPRPAYSVLSNASWREAGLTPLSPWEDALKEYFARS